MSRDEVIRTIAYIVMMPGLSYVGVRVWNAVIMPEELRRPVAITLWLQSAIYMLLMAGLLLTRLWQPVPGLLYLNTIFILMQAAMIVLVCVRVSRLRRYVPLVVPVLLALLALLF